MKIIQKEVLPFQEKDFFSPIRDKIDYARIIIYASRNLILNVDNSDIKCFSNMKLIVDKMSRLFFYKGHKYFSISFPFIVQLEDDKISQISTLNGTIIDSHNLSSALLILNDENFKLNPSLLDFYIESNNFESIGVNILEEIFQSEPGYIRYDNDPKNQKDKKHPLNHLDVNYSSYGTYKLGLKEIIIENYFENVLNINTDCSYLSD